MTLDLQQLRQVVALAEHRSFVRAATALHISQPALSRSIQHLERRFGSPLFVRSSGGVVPTDLGSLYIERSRDLLRMADELEAEAVGQSKMRVGRVDVGGGPYPSDSLLSPACARFVEAYPGVSVQLHSGNWDDLMQRLRARALDYFVADMSLLPRDPDLEVTALPARHALYFFARADHPLAGQRDMRTADIFEWPFVTPSRIPPRVLDPLLAAHREGSARQPVARPLPAIQCNGLSAVKRIVATSNAISASILPCIDDELESGRFVLLGTEPWMFLQYGIASLVGRPWTQTAIKLREFVLQAEHEAIERTADLVVRHAPEHGSERHA
jgi:DNA-binding transcriptional LysR family regulator